MNKGAMPERYKPEERLMDLSYSDEEKAFRAEVRAFLEEKLPKEMSDKIRKGDELGKAGQEEW
ncbi:MAG: hypothetical protein ACI83E_001852, partial [Sulfitobacter sp.]